MTRQTDRQAIERPESRAVRAPFGEVFRRLVPSGPKILPLLVASAVLAAYAGSLNGVFLLDDAKNIVRNPVIRAPTLPGILRGGRPLLDLTFALNYRLHGLDVTGYHVVNVGIHVCSALLLFGLLRRILERWTGARQAVSGAAAPVAAAAAALWGVHPLTVSAVTYLSQRAESLMAMLCLLAVNAATRDHSGGAAGRVRAALWQSGAVLACMAGAAVKEGMLVCPVLVLLCEWAMDGRSPPRAVRGRPMLYAGLAGAWLVAVLLAAARRQVVDDAIYAWPGTSPWRYFLTQCQVIMHYLRLTVWPDSLCLDYDWPPVADWRAVWPQALSLCGLAGAGFFMFLRRNPAGLGVVWFFVALAPASSFVPRPDCAFEHRMYLPLCGVAVSAAAAVLLSATALQKARLAGWIRAAATGAMVCALGAAALALAVRTADRNRDYRSVEAMWRDTVLKRPQNLRARLALVSTLLRRGGLDEAERAARDLLNAAWDAARREPPGIGAARAHYRLSRAHNQLGRVLLARGRFSAAAVEFRQALRVRPDYTVARHNLAVAFYLSGDCSRARETAAQASAEAPGYAPSHSLLARLQAEAGDYAAAARGYRRSVELDPDALDVAMELAWLLATAPDDSVRAGPAARVLAERVVRATARRSPMALDVLAAASAECGDYASAAREASEALEMLRMNTGGEDAATSGSRDLPPGLDGLPGEAGAGSRTDGLRRRLNLYRNGRPYRLVAVPRSPPTGDEPAP